MRSGLRPFDNLTGGFRWLLWRLLVFVSVVTMGVVGLRSGVGLSERPGVETADFLTQLYDTLGLFVFGGLDLGTPQNGPPWARALLWIAFFAAPAITTTALVEGVLLVLRPHAWRLRRLRDHVVIGGCGRLTLLYIDRLRKKRPRQQLLVVDNRADHPLLETINALPRTRVLYGDISSEAVLRAVRLEHARSVVLLTGDDYANLDAASRVSRIRPELERHCVVHVSDIRLLRDIERAEILPGIAKFNSYRSATKHLVVERLIPHFRRTERLDTVVLAGFGRFGQTVLDELQQQALGLFQTVVLIDLEAERLALIFDDQLGFSSEYRHEIVQENLRHPVAWQRAQKIIGQPETQPVFIVGSGDDGVNIRTALWLSRKYSEARIVARCFDQSEFTRRISKKCGFEIVSTADLLLESLDWPSGDLG